MKMILSPRKRDYIAKVGIFLITVALVALVVEMGGCNKASSPGEIRNWHDLNAIRNNLGGDYILMNNLDFTTAGYTELASPAANQGRGWEPIGTGPLSTYSGSFDGQGFEIRDLFIDHPSDDYVGLVGDLNTGAIVKNVGVVNATVTGNSYVGGLVGCNYGTVINSYYNGTVTGSYKVGGLVGVSVSPISNSHFSGSVSGDSRVGGLLGDNHGTVINCYSNAIVAGTEEVGGLTGYNYNTVSQSYSTGNVTGNSYVGGLAGWNLDTVNNSYSNASVNGVSLVGGLVGSNAATVSNSHSSGNVTGSLYVGGLVGRNYEGTVSNSFWNTKTSGQATSDGGTAENTTQMKDIATFSGAGWNIIAVNSGQTNPAYIWNIVNTVTYPFLSWQ
jgi:hypothetical protein